MPHIHTNPGQHDHTVTGYIIRDDGDEPRVFLHMHRKQHVLMPVGGHIELSETPWDSIAHEMQEESGFKIQDLEIMQPKRRIAHQRDDRTVHPQPVVMDTHYVSDDHWHSDTSYLFVAHGEPSSLPVEGESQDIRWLTEKELLALDESAIRAFTRDVYLECLRLVMKEWERMPATAFRLGKVC